MTAAGSRNGRTVGNDPAELRQEIERTRAELGETVEALAAKADVKARAQESVDAAKVRAQETVASAKLRVREGVQQAAVNAAYAGRELRAHPGQQVRLTLGQLRRSARENTAQWAAVVAVLLLGAFIVGRRRQR